MSDPYQVQSSTTFYPEYGDPKRTMFRSLLEARWAMAFTMMHQEWLYEPHQFEMPGAVYTPDFYLKGVGWVEIKPHFEALKDVEQKLHRFAEYKSELIAGGASQRFFSIDAPHPTYEYKSRDGRSSVLEWVPGGIRRMSKEEAARELCPPQDRDFLSEHPNEYIDFVDSIFAFTENARFDGPRHFSEILMAATQDFRDKQLEASDAENEEAEEGDLSAMPWTPPQDNAE